MGHPKLPHPPPKDGGRVGHPGDINYLTLATTARVGHPATAKARATTPLKPTEGLNGAPARLWVQRKQNRDF